MLTIHCAQVNVNYVLKGVAHKVVLVHCHNFYVNSSAGCISCNTIIVNRQGEQVLIGSPGLHCTQKTGKYLS